MDEALPNPPAQLKALLPFVQRANELRTADKVIAYWCCYYAAQLGISGNPSDKEAKMYLLTLMDTLEDLKSKLADNDAVTNDAASSAYVENFALKVFVGADNQDRAGKATRATAKTFLAASQFIELLKIFGTIEPEMQEKIKYAKWKAADIAKAFKEGRRPTPGPAGGDPKLEAASVEAAMGLEAVTKDEQEYLAREMAKLTTGASDEAVAGAGAGVPDVAHLGKEAPAAPSTTIVPSIAAPPSDMAPPSVPSLSRGSSSGGQNVVDAASVASQGRGSASPDAEEMWKRRSSEQSGGAMSRSSSTHQLDSNRPQLPASTSFVAGQGSSPGSRPLPVPPQRDGLPIPPVSAHHQFGGSPGADQGIGPGAAPPPFWGASAPLSGSPHLSDGDESVLPSVPSDHPPSLSRLDSHPAIERIDPPRSPSHSQLPASPGQGSMLPHEMTGSHLASAPPSAPSFITAPSVHAKAQAPVAPPMAVPIAPAIAPPAFPESLDSRLSTRVQKLAKGAASAVDFEDLETARLQLRQALDILEGRVTR
ncbi:hypothetical protein PaG_02623 [Moesziomyces aphidis]|uniref:DUF605-domain-containing protein n=1 Tax=Moesziomyces aphidis TaxID=84754 RepID=W3VN00_MOEAP|nr:hypothetical protein PaG_02623 [Moesziomyces aphidis]